MRLINALFEDRNFIVDEYSVPYVVRDIVNMNWWNTCGYLLGYQKNKRVNLTYPTKQMKLWGIILKEFYRHNQLKVRDVSKLEKELEDYIDGKNKMLRQLKLFSMPYRRNDSQYFYKDNKVTWLDCTSRATYAWKYVGQNGYIDFDSVCRVIDGSKIINYCKKETAYPYKDELLNLFAEGENKVKIEIFSQRNEQITVNDWVDKLNIKVIESRKWLFDLVSHVKTDPYKNNEKRLLKEGKLFGNNELLYGYKTNASLSISNASNASNSSNASNASRASNASSASRASDASSESRTSDASSESYAGVIDTKEIGNWFIVPNAIGELKGLQHPPIFKKNKFGIAGHWKINKDLVSNCTSWIDPFLGHGESPLYAKKEGKNFTGIEINPDSMNGYLLPYVQKAVNEHGDRNIKVDLILGDSTIFRKELIGKFDLCYTSPPYFDFEDYGFHNKVIQDCFNYDEYHERVTKLVFRNVHQYLVDDGILALQTEKEKRLKDKWVDAIIPLGFELLEDTITGQEKNKYSIMSKRDQSLLIFKKIDNLDLNNF